DAALAAVSSEGVRAAHESGRLDQCSYKWIALFKTVFRLSSSNPPVHPSSTIAEAYAVALAGIFLVFSTTVTLRVAFTRERFAVGFKYVLLVPDLNSSRPFDDSEYNPESIPYSGFEDAIFSTFDCDSQPDYCSDLNTKLEAKIGQTRPSVLHFVESNSEIPNF
ncbi:unnamed protein product, partial [Rhizoctonia solani]